MPHPDNDLVCRYLYEMPYGQQALFFSEELYTKVGGINRKLKFSMDYELYVRMHLYGANVIRMDEHIGSIRNHRTTKTSTLQHQMYFENAQTLTTVFDSAGCKRESDFMKKLNFEPLGKFIINHPGVADMSKTLLSKFLKKNIWYYYNNHERKTAAEMAIQIIKTNPWEIFNLNYLKIIKDGKF